MDLPSSLIIKRGTILHSVIFEYIDHGKFFVIMGEDDKNYIGLFFINSKINSFNNKPLLRQMQYEMRVSDYDFLDHDSYLCCTELTKIDKKRLDESLSEGTTQYKGFMQQDHLDAVLQLVRGSKLFSEQEKQLFFI